MPCKQQSNIHTTTATAAAGSYGWWRPQQRWSDSVIWLATPSLVGYVTNYWLKQTSCFLSATLNISNSSIVLLFCISRPSCSYTYAVQSSIYSWTSSSTKSACLRSLIASKDLCLITTLFAPNTHQLKSCHIAASTSATAKPPDIKHCPEPSQHMRGINFVLTWLFLWELVWKCIQVVSGIFGATSTTRLTICTLPETVLMQIVYFFHVFCRSLVLILPVPRVPGVQRGSIFFRLKEFFWWSFYVQIGLLQFVVYCLTVAKKVTPGHL